MKKNERNQNLYAWIMSLGMICLVTVYMPFFLYAMNSKEINFSEAVLPMVMLLFIALSIYAISFILSRNQWKAGVCTALLMLLLENYYFLEKTIRNIFPTLKYWHVLSILIFIFLHICFFLCKKIKEETLKSITNVVSIAVGVLIIINLFTAMPNVISKMKVSNDEQKEQNVVSGEKISHDGANIYYFLLDEAAPFHIMEQYYEANMTEYREFYQNKDFFISDDSYNEAITTKIVLTNLFNLDYVAKYSNTDKELEQLRKNGDLFEILQKQQYEVIGVGDTEWLGIPSVTGTVSSGVGTIDGKNMSQVIMGNTFLYPFLRQNYNEREKDILGVFDYFEGDIYGTHSEFKFIYMSCPHQPFLFDENGKLNSNGFTNWEDEKYYAGQYKFVMNRMEKVIEKIIKKDPNSIIIVSSDHGARFHAEISSEQAKNILNIIYYKGEDISEALNLSSVNTLRTILSKQFQIKLDLREVPNEN